MHDHGGDGTAIPRRRMLKVLAAAPAAIAGCAGVSAEQAARDPSFPPAGGPAGAARDAAVEEALAAVRGFPLAPDAEPAFVFRATAARPGVPR